MIHPVLISLDWFSGGELFSVRRLRGVAGVHARLRGLGGEGLEEARARARGLGLGLAAVEVTGDVNRVAESVEAIKGFAGVVRGQGVMVELGLMSTGGYDMPGAARADVRAGEVLRGVVGAFVEAGVGVSLRHRRGAWMEKIQDSVRVLMRVNRAEYGVVLSLPDWLEADGTGLSDRMHLALPRLTNLVIDGGGEKGEYPGGGQVLNRFAGMGYVGPVTLVPGEGEAGAGWEGIERAMAGLG